MDTRFTPLYKKQVGMAECEPEDAFIFPNDEKKEQNIEEVTDVDKEVITKKEKDKKARQEQKAAKIASGKTSKRQLRDETKSEKDDI